MMASYSKDALINVLVAFCNQRYPEVGINRDIIEPIVLEISEMGDVIYSDEGLTNTDIGLDFVQILLTVGIAVVGNLLSNAAWAAMQTREQKEKDDASLHAMLQTPIPNEPEEQLAAALEQRLATHQVNDIVHELMEKLNIPQGSEEEQLTTVIVQYLREQHATELVRALRGQPPKRIEHVAPISEK
jgi:hypothetical protein